MGGDGPRYDRLGRAIQGVETRRLSFRRKPGDALAGRGHSGGIDAAELGRHEKSAARRWSDLVEEAENGGEHEARFYKEERPGNGRDVRLSTFASARRQ